MKKANIIYATFILGASVVGTLSGYAASSKSTAPDTTLTVCRVAQTCAVTVDSVTIQLLEGELFEAEAYNSNVINYHNFKINADSVALKLDDNRLSNVSNGYANVIPYVQVKGDSLMFDFAKSADSTLTSVRVVNAKNGAVLLDVAKDSAEYLPLDSALAVSAIRLVPTGHISEVIELSTLLDTETFKRITAPKEIDKGDSDKASALPLLIIVAVVAMLIGAGLAFLLLRPKKKVIETSDEGDESADDINASIAVEDATPEQLAAQLRQVTAYFNTAVKERDALHAKLKKEQETRQKAIDDRVADAENEARRRVDDADRRADKAEQKSRDTEAQVTARFEGQISDLNADLDALQKKYDTTSGKLRETVDALNAETAALDAEKKENNRLNAAIARFDDKLADAAFAQPYCTKIVSLLELSGEIQATANATLDVDVEDPYFICKALARFNAAVGNIALPALYSDVDMILQTGFVPKGTPLSTYDTNKSASELEELTKNYYFVNFLEKYIDALVVLNESMAGLKYLMPDMPADAVQPFEVFRGRIQQVCADLGVTVLSVKIFDSVGSNIDLLATEIDGGYDKSGAILDIENCIVMLAGAPRNDDKRIRVKVQL